MAILISFEIHLCHDSCGVKHCLQQLFDSSESSSEHITAELLCIADPTIQMQFFKNPPAS